MIHGPSKLVRIIVAKTLPGYGGFTDAAYDKQFVGGESLVIYYPPDHPNAGQKYPYTTLATKDSSAAGLNIMGLFWQERERQSSNRPEDPVQSYQKEMLIDPFFSATEGFHPAINATGYDSFIIRGSIIEGVSSGARRFYDGPFKGYTVETQNGCTGSGEVEYNQLDGSSCEGYLKGSFHESGYFPDRHDVFKYQIGQPWVVNPRSPMNENFMAGTPFSLDMNWLSVRNRRERPIPYRMTSTNSSGHTAILITTRHAIVSGHHGYGYPYRFYSPSGGIVTRTTTESTATIGPYTDDVYTRDFKNMWHNLGFRDPTGNAEALSTYNSLMEHFKDCTIVTLNEDVPGDINPISIIDKATSDLFHWAMVIGQEGRGHLAYNCTPQTRTTEWSFTPCMNCDLPENINSILPPSCSHNDVGLMMCMGDSGSPAITYYRGSPVFMGMLTNTTSNLGTLKYYSNQKTVMVESGVADETCETHPVVDYHESGQSSYGEFIGGRGIGSSTTYDLPWGHAISPIQFLNMWLQRAGSDYSATTVSIIKESTDTPLTYPSPSSGYVDRPIPKNSDGTINDSPVTVLSQSYQTA